MQTINIHESKKHLSRLIDMAAAGEAFIIAKAGKPMVKVTFLVDPAPAPATTRQLGFMPGQMLVPDDFDAMGMHEIEALFNGK